MLRKCPYCGGCVDISLSTVSRTFWKISHLCNEGRVYVCVTDEDKQKVIDTWNGMFVINYKTKLGDWTITSQNEGESDASE